jgi:anti-sigma regulatory factor (Ser/Thr protein kinase)
MSWPADGSMAHRALLYTGEPEFRAAVGAFIREGLDRREQILAAVPAGQLAWLRGELGGDVPAVEFADAASFYRRQGQATRATVDWLRRYASDGQRVRVVAEQASSRRTPAEAADYLRMEAAANVVYQPFPVSVLCPYDVSVLPDDLRPGVEQTHPELLQGDRVVSSPAFADPRIFIRDFSAVAPPPLTSASIGFSRGEDLAGVRRFLRAQLARAGLGSDAASLLVAAAAEVVTNALQHGTAPGRLWVYTEGPMLVCHVRDGGPGFADPLAAYLAPDRHATHGHGLWLGRQACDCLEAATDETGTHVRLLTRWPQPGAPEALPWGEEDSGP